MFKRISFCSPKQIIFASPPLVAKLLDLMSKQK